MKRKSSTTSQGGAGFFSRMGIAGISTLLMLLMTWSSGFSQSFPFPQNFKYAYGVLPESDPSTMAEKVQVRYDDWYEKYYEEETIGGTTYGRIKFSQVGEDGSATVSEGIAYGMLVFVYMDNATNATQDEFDACWEYYKRYSNENGVMHWKIDAFGDPGTAVIDPNGATDAEIDVATALLLAYKQWGEKKYLEDAKTLINTIWNYEIEHATKAVLPGDAVGFNQVLNPCYFITNGLELFQEAAQKYPDDLPDLDWGPIIDKSYEIMEMSADPKTGLIPDWVYNQPGVYPNITGVVDFEPNPSDPKFTSHYKYDAVRIPWRLAHAYAWYGHPKAKELATNITDWAISEYGKSGAANMVDGYELDGTPLGASSNACFTGGFACGGMVADPSDANMITFLTSGFNQTDLGENGSYFNHTTQLLYMMVMSGNMPNFFAMSPTVIEAEIPQDLEGENNVLLLTLSQAIEEASVSADGWVLTTDNGDLPVNILSAEYLNEKQIKLVIDGTIVDGGTTIAYDETAGSLAKLEGGTKVPSMDPFLVVNNNPFKRPEILSISSSPDGTKIIMALDQPLKTNTFVVAHDYFELTSGGNSLTFSSTEASPDDASIVFLTIEGSDQVANRVQEGDEVTLTMTTEVLLSESFTKVKAFTDREVENLTFVVKCDIISDSEGESMGTWNTAPVAADDTFSAFEANPLQDDVNPSATAVYFKREDTSSDGAEWSAPKFTIASGFFNDVMKDKTDEAGQAVLNFKLYAPNTADVGTEVMFMFFNSADDDENGSYSQAGHNFKEKFVVAETGKWVNVELDLSLFKNSTIEADMFEFSINRGETAAGQEIYIDDIKLCTPQPSAQIAKAMTDFYGNKIKAEFKTAMAIPSDFSGFELGYSDGYMAVTEVEIDPTNSNMLILTLDGYLNASETDIFLSYTGEAVKTVDGRALEAFKNVKVINAVSRAITTGWRDDFDDCSKGDYVTQNIGGNQQIYGALGAGNEVCNGHPAYPGEAGTYEIKTTASYDDYAAWEPWGVFLSDAIMDLSGKPTVEIGFTCTETVYIRCDLKDLINDRNTDQMPEVKFAPGTHTHTFTFEGVKLLNEYGMIQDPDGAPGDMIPGNRGAVDITNISDVMFYTWTEVPSPANGYVPTIADEPIYFDYINVGASVTLTDVPASVAQGDSFSPKSSETGSIFLLSADKIQDETGKSQVERELGKLKYYVEQGYGVEIPCEKDVAVTIETGDLSGYYHVLSYDPETQAISFPKGVTVNDVTKPIITEATTGVKMKGSVVSASADEAATFYIVEAGKSTINYELASSVKANASNKLSAPFGLADEFVDIELTSENKINIGSQYLLFAIDGSGNISEASDTIFVTTLGNPAITITSPEPYELLSTIQFEVDRDCSVIIVAADDVNEENLLESGAIEVKGETATDLELVERYEWIPFTEIYYGFEDKKEYTIIATEAGSGKVGTKTFMIGSVPKLLESISVPATLEILPTKSSDVKIAFNPTDANDIESVTVTSDSGDLTVLQSDQQNFTLTAADVSAEVVATVTVEVVATTTFTKTIEVTIPYDPGIVLPESVEYSLNPTGTTLDVGASTIISATVFDADGSSAEVSQDVNMTITAGEEFATLENGKLTGVAAGDVTVEISSKLDNTVKTSFTITVKEVEVTDVNLNQETIELMIGEDATQPIQVEVLPASANVTPTVSLVQTPDTDLTDASDVISYNEETGAVTALAPGTAKVVFSAGGIDATCEITVSMYEPASITVKGNAYVQDAVPAGEKVSYTITPPAGVDLELVDQRVTFATSDDQVFTVFDGVLVEGGALGTAEVTVTSVANTAISGKADYSISKDIIVAASVEFDLAKTTLSKDETLTLAAVVKGAGDVNATDQGVTFAIKSGDAVTLDGDVITAVKAGDVVIEVTTDDGGITETITITVKVIYPSSVSITSETTLELEKEETSVIEYSFSPDDAIDDIAFSVPAEYKDIISVSTSGLITALDAGTGIVEVVSVNDQTTKQEVTVTVIIPAEALILNDADAQVIPSGTVDLSSYVSIDPIDATQSELEWSVGSGATIDADGVLTAGSSETTVEVTVSVKENPALTQTITVVIKDEVVPVDYVKFNTDAVTIKEGEEITVTVQTNSDATVKTLNISSNNNNATFTETEDAGVYTLVITGAAEGTTVITAVSTDDANKVDEITITVEAVEKCLTSLAITDELNLLVATSGQIVATTGPDGHDAVEIEYAVISGGFYATVSADGLVEANPDLEENKTAVVEATAECGGDVFTAQCTVNIVYEAPKVTSFSIDQDASDLTGKITGDKGQITVTNTPGDAIAESIKFESNSIYVEIDPATGVWEVKDQNTSVETVTITVTIDDNLTQTIELEVAAKTIIKEPVTALNVSTADLEILFKKTLDLPAVQVVPAAADNKKIIWEIDGFDKEVEFTQDGAKHILDMTATTMPGTYVGTTFKVRAISDDDNSITTDWIDVTIEKVAVTGFIFGTSASIADKIEDELTLEIGETQQIYLITVEPLDATFASTYSLESGDESVVEIAGGTGRLVKVVGAGTAEITITVDDYSQTFDVVVEAETLDYAELETQVGLALTEAKRLGDPNSEIYQIYLVADDVLDAAIAGNTTQAAIDEQVQIIKNYFNPITNVKDITVGLFPVPFSTSLTVEATDIVSVEIVSATGVVAVTETANGADKVEVEAAALSAGVYQVKVTTATGVKTVTVSKK